MFPSRLCYFIELLSTSVNGTLGQQVDLAKLNEVSVHLIAIETPAGLLACPMINSIEAAALEGAFVGILAFT
jgi:hypothetical protein